MAYQTQRENQMQKYEVTVDTDGTTRWYQNGKLHRLDGPAVKWANGNTLWYQNGLRHRLDGPAIEYADGYKVWYIEGKEYTEAEFLAKTQPVREMTLQQIIDELGYQVKIVK